MPNPKVGTVTFDVARAIREVKAGKVEFKVDKAGNVHVPVGKRSFAAAHLAANAMRDASRRIVKAKPAAAKGQYLRIDHGVDDDGARRPRGRPARRQSVQDV